MSGEGFLAPARAAFIKPELEEHALTTAVEAYDAARIAAWQRDGIRPGTPMSARNMETIRPLIGAAIMAYLDAADGL